MKRRSFLWGASALGCSLWLPSQAGAQAPLAANPFGLGVASGHPMPDGVVLWTRLMASQNADRLGPPIEVDWAIAEDEAMTRVVQSGKTTAEARLGHSVHVDVGGLSPGRHYWYRFTAAGKQSPIGRTRTAPAPTDKPEQLRFTVASCQQYEQGFFSAYRHMAAEDLDAVLFVGDYIYETSWGRDLVRRHEAGRTLTLDDYRNRYALYKSDRDLQAAHAAHPWIVTWDDHEVVNDYADDLSPTDPEPQPFLAIRAAAYQAFWEHMPLPNAMQPKGPAMRLYQRYRFGDLVELFTLDDRQYRSHNACHAEKIRSRMLVDCAERLAAGRTMLGAEQEAWFASGMARASARWNVVAQQTLMAELDRGGGDKHRYWADGWDGYPLARQRLLDAAAASPTKDTLVLGGDVHSFWAADLKRDFADPKAPTVATEFVGGSITSQGPPGSALPPLLARNPHVLAAVSDVNGYGLVTLDRQKALVAFRTLRDVRDPGTGISTVQQFVVEAGKPGAVRG
jgi:alkaline phosphatase D